MANMHLITGYAGTEHIRSADEGALNAAIMGNIQAVLAKGNQLSASAISNNTVRVLDGDIIMQGRHIRLNENTYVDLTIDSGEQGLKRNDLIVARYTKNAATAVEEVNLVVINGTAAESEPSDPVYTVGDILNEGATLNDMPLYRIPLDGINLGEPVKLFSLFTATVGDAEEHIKDSSIHVTTAEKTVWNAKAGKATDTTATLTADGWANNAQTVTVDGMTADKKIFVGLSSATAEQFEAAAGAMLMCTAQAAGTITVTAFGDAPTLDLPIIVREVG